MRVDVDNDRCTGLGICESIVPDVFEVEDDGTLTIHQSEVNSAERAELEQAVRSCPIAALRLVE